MRRSCPRPRTCGVASRCQRVTAAVAILLVILLALPAKAQTTVSDPLEPLNRGVFEFNRIADGLVLKPASQIYEFAVPQPVRRSVSNFLDNLRTPLYFANHLLQGEREQAGVALGRFMVNSTLGVFGLFDFATVLGVEPLVQADFGQTLGTYGVGNGVYLVLPIIGPSTLRDAGGLAVDWMILDPFPHFTDAEVELARRGAGAVDARYRYGELLDDLEAQSLDFYIAARSAYLQNRAARIRKDSGERDDAYEAIFEDEAFDNDIE